MADFKLECMNCGALFQVSEYIESPTVRCPQCDEELEIAKAALKIDSGLRVCHDKMGSGLAESDSTVPPVAEPPPMSKKMKKEMQKARRLEEKRKKDKKDPYERNAPKPWHGWVVLVLMTAVLLGLQHVGAGENAGYYRIRLVLFPLIYLMIIVTAFKEGYLCGFLCLLLPPYLFYYAVSRTDVFYIRGAFTAMIICLVMELYYNSERAFFTHAKSSINQIIDGGAGAINRAGSAGVEFID